MIAEAISVLVLIFLISSCGIFNYLSRIWVLKYTGAFVIIRRIFDLNRCKMAIFVTAADPQSWIPYVHMGFTITNYISEFYYTDIA